MCKKFLFLLMIALVITSLPLSAFASESLTAMDVAYTQNFNTLASAGSASMVPNGWAFFETSGNANTLYTAGTGLSNTGDTYSFGAAGSNERAFGMLLSNSLFPTIGASFTNNTGQTITKLFITYTGEEWRLGAGSRTDRIDFQYSTNATSLNTGSWTDVNELDFSTPDTSGVGSKDGNSAAERQTLSFAITGLNILDGETFWIRWLDYNVTSNDDGLAVDDFSLIPLGEASFDLIAGGGNPASAMDIGYVSVSDNGSDLTVQYVIDTGDWEFAETHLHVVPNPPGIGAGGIPRVKKGCPVPGMFAYADPPEEPPISQTYTLSIIDDIFGGTQPEPGLYTLYIAAHAAIGYIDDMETEDPLDDVLYNETAWAGGEEGIKFTKCKNWATYITYSLVVPELP